MLKGQEGMFEDCAARLVFLSLMGKNQKITFITDKSSNKVISIESYSKQQSIQGIKNSNYSHKLLNGLKSGYWLKITILSEAPGPHSKSLVFGRFNFVLFVAFSFSLNLTHIRLGPFEKKQVVVERQFFFHVIRHSPNYGQNYIS